jgi:hypothetical protein
VIRTCADTSRDNRGLILPLEDRDVIELLSFVVARRRSDIDTWLFGLSRQILAP